MATDLMMRLLGMNAAAALAVLAVLALRKPGRARLGAQCAYALWLIVPAVMLASLLPPRTILVPAPKPPVVMPAMTLAPDAAIAPAAELPESVRTAPPASAPKSRGPNLSIPQVLVGVWLSGIAVSLILLVIGQRRALAQFGRIVPDAQDPRLARASNPMVGPALLGTVRPRVIVPADFEAQFDAKEQAMILAHERTHLAKGHAVINALVALIKALHWFNPLLHLAARCARVDQELACDAAVIERFPGERQAYAQALLKTQLTFMTLPLGCQWPVRSPGRLEERIQMLAQGAPGRLPLRAGAGVVAVLAAGAGVAAWASQPPVAKLVPAATPVQGAATAPQSAPVPVLAHQDPQPSEPQPAAATQDAGPSQAIVPARAESPAPAAGNAPAASPADVVARLRAEQAAPRQLVPFDPAHFDRYVGDYELAPYFIFKVTRAGDKFYSQLPGQPQVEVFPESETKFFATVVAAQLSFVSDGNGTVTGLVLHQNGREQPARRITEEAAKASGLELAARVRTNAPSPGTEASIRKWLLALQAGQPDYEDMTPALADAARDQWPQTSLMVKPFGALKTITFQHVDVRGNDVYRVEFEHAVAEVMVAPLTADGKVAARGWRVLPNEQSAALVNHRKDTAPSPGTEAFLRQYLASASKGQPDYSGMDPALAAGARSQWPARGPIILSRGALKSLAFLRVSPEGYDVYDAIYEHAEVIWSVAPLGPDGKESYSSGDPVREKIDG